jgi:hypothetical protein
MESTAARPTRVLKAHILFALVFSLLGWGMLESWLVEVHAPPTLHLLSTACALCLSGVALGRYRLYRRHAGAAYVPWHPQVRRVGVAGAGWTPLMLAVGSVLGMFVLAGWALPLGILAAGLMFLPLPQAALRHGQFTASCAAVLAGSATVLVLGRHEIRPLFLPLAAWVLWVCACSALVLAPRASAQDQFSRDMGR